VDDDRGRHLRHRLPAAGDGRARGLGCNLSEDALYPGTATDADGGLLTGERRHVLRFEPGRLPPANAFWSLTMYDEQGFQVPNPIDGFALGDRDPMNYNADGSLDIYLQTTTPAPTASQTGCRRSRASSVRGYGCTPPSQRRSTAAGAHPPCAKPTPKAKGGETGAGQPGLPR
jgi:Protein of unknown function (DUF1214)